MDVVVKWWTLYFFGEAKDFMRVFLCAYIYLVRKGWSEFCDRVL